jgi:hypothetical protein
MSMTGSDYRSHAWREVLERWGIAKSNGKWMSSDQGTVLRSGMNPNETLEKIRKRQIHHTK